jgi:hypothetical protein
LKISYIQNITELKGTETRITFNLIEKFNQKGIQVLVNDCDDDCDFILSMNGLSQMNRFKDVSEKFPDKKKIMYVWDCYPWTKYFNEFEWVSNCDQIWVPSNAVSLRLNEAYNIPFEKIKRIKCYAEFFESKYDSAVNNGFVYHPVRKYNDINFEILDNACNELGIEFFRSNHSLSYSEYKSRVLSCSFLVTEYMEASTGGLTLLEGYYNGKDVLISDSIYQGASDYFGDRAYYFKQGDYEDFKNKIKMLYEKQDTIDLEDRRNWCKQYTIDAMMERIINSLKELQ